MKAKRVWLAVALVILTGSSAALAVDLKDKVKVEVLNVGLHPGMDPGLYVCAAGHLHIKGNVQNLSGVPLGHVKVTGRAFDADGKLLGTATSATKPPTLAPNERAEINLEFLTITGPKVQEVKKYDLAVVEAPPKE